MSAPRRLPWIFERWGEGTVRRGAYLPDVGRVGAYPTFVGSAAVTPTLRPPSQRHESESPPRHEALVAHVDRPTRSAPAIHIRGAGAADRGPGRRSAIHPRVSWDRRFCEQMVPTGTCREADRRRQENSRARESSRVPARDDAPALHRLPGGHTAPPIFCFLTVTPSAPSCVSTMRSEGRGE